MNKKVNQLYKIQLSKFMKTDKDLDDILEGLELDSEQKEFETFKDDYFKANPSEMISECSLMEEFLNRTGRKVDNTYNWSESFVGVVQFALYNRLDRIRGKKTEDAHNCDTLIIQFHLGGDVRGNYTDAQVYDLSHEDNLNEFMDFLFDIHDTVEGKLEEFKLSEGLTDDDILVCDDLD